ncbi:DUF928 domain-containing protein [Nodosilinea sp. P-1105]|uniref:DUF928 domain-containing protein n=1 Tax=Nodosilinea sp. P-1105 TaxID=2546229 RepID=UPI00146AD2EA|nr:DUF928 domain-containing protein [Nodosilinea sp. P-1105]NMF83368.1 DUF928 domain-containing protein [Nodosilinea sp. P-1105]
MIQYSGMRRSTLAITLLSLGSLTGLWMAASSPSWGRTLPTGPQSGPGQVLTQRGNQRGYQPPPNTRAPRRTTGGGTRGGCAGDAPIDLTILAPQGHVGQTAMSHPTLVWYVPDDTPYDTELQLYRYAEAQGDELEPIAVFDLGPSQSGYQTFTLPDDQPGLTVGETYRWKVIVHCFPGQPSRSALDEADLVVVADGVDQPAADPVSQAEQAIAAGLWYDAIALLSQAPVSPEAATYRQALLANLAALEAENPNDDLSLFSERLLYLANP